MSKLTINSHAEFEQYIGKELGASDFMTITQDRINKFADATDDHQWIHTEPDRAKKEGGFGSTIAHGYLNISIAPFLWKQIAEIRNIDMMINYGIEDLKFNQPVLVDSEVRLTAKLKSLANLRGISKCHLQVTLEIRGNSKPAFSGVLVFLYYFNNNSK
ncbi:MAG: MaoC family dehydratase [Cyclobacteriaceae bacterium]|nr:MaoC family dehydratase [Cyclobacteriaceae bacterium]